MSSDWIRLHRKSLDSQVFSDPELWHLFCWCLLKANWKVGYYLGSEIPAGSFVTGRESASAELKINASTWYKRVRKLQSLSLISVKSNNKFSVITVEKWRDYQAKSQGSNNKVTTEEQQSNNEVTTGEQPGNTIEEGKEGKEGKNAPVQKPCDVDQETWDDWLAVRKAKRAGKVTNRVIAAIRKEADLIGWTLEQALDKCAVRNWISFEAKWVADESMPVKQKIMDLEVFNLNANGGPA